jgi:hypothetical protein
VIGVDSFHLPAEVVAYSFVSSERTFFRFLIANDLFADKQVEQCSCILCLGHNTAENERSGRHYINQSFKHQFSSG